jgi:chromosome segregation ATPase
MFDVPSTPSINDSLKRKRDVEIEINFLESKIEHKLAELQEIAQSTVKTEEEHKVRLGRMRGIVSNLHTKNITLNHDLAKKEKEIVAKSEMLKELNAEIIKTGDEFRRNLRKFDFAIEQKNKTKEDIERFINLLEETKDKKEKELEAIDEDIKYAMNELALFTSVYDSRREELELMNKELEERKKKLDDREKTVTIYEKRIAGVYAALYPNIKIKYELH